MPELPEVETIVRSLRNSKEQPQPDAPSLREQPGIVGRQIRDVQLLWQRTLAVPTPDEFDREMRGQIIQSVDRRGKFLLLNLAEGTLLIHLRMSGDLRVEEQRAALQPHDRLILNFVDGMRLVFNDTRKFGRAWWVNDAQEVLANLGPEPFDPALSGFYLYERWHQSSRAIKTLLLDQKLLAGVGNIYSDEALFLARIHPSTQGKALSPADCERLLSSIRSVLDEGIRRNGASIDWVYRGGDFQNYFNVYQRTGDQCKTCGSVIERIVIGQRSSHFCPVCQPTPKINS